MEDRNRAQGLLMAAASSFFFSVESLLAKVADLPPIVIAWYGYLGLTLLSVPVLLSHTCWNLSPKAARLIAFRSVIVTICHITAFTAIELIPLGDASVLFYTAPVYTILLARVFLKEPCTCFNVGVIFVVMFGIVLVTQPPLTFLSSTISPTYFKGVVMGLIAALTDAIGNVVLRELKSVHYSTVMFLHGILSLTFTSALIPFTDWTPKPTAPLLPLLMSVFSAMEQFSLAWALNAERAGPVSLCQVFDIIFAYSFQVLFFDEQITFISFLGGSIIAVAVLAMTMREETPEGAKLPAQNV